MIGLSFIVNPKKSPTPSTSNHNPPQTQNNPPQITNNPPQISNSQQKPQQITTLILSPEDIVKEQYSLINQRQYEKAWNHLTANFRDNLSIFTNGFNSYINWWDKVNYIEVNQTQLINQKPQNAPVNVKLKLLMKNGRVSKETRRIALVWDEQTKIWMIDKTTALTK
jgi:hypothetical protein